VASRLPTNHNVTQVTAELRWAPAIGPVRLLTDEA
jgi:hypothetical protein